MGALRWDQASGTQVWDENAPDPYGTVGNSGRNRGEIYRTQGGGDNETMVPWDPSTPEFDEVVTVNGQRYYRVGGKADGYAARGIAVTPSTDYGPLVAEPDFLKEKARVEKEKSGDFWHGAGPVALASAAFGGAAMLGGAAAGGAAEGAGGLGLGGEAINIPPGWGQLAELSPTTVGGTMIDAGTIGAGGVSSGAASLGAGSGGLTMNSITTALSSPISSVASAAMRLLQGGGTADDLKTIAATVGTGLAVGAGVKALSNGGLGGSTSQTTTSNLPPMTDEERQLVQLNAELTKKQLAAIDSLQPFQKQMIELALEQMKQQSAADATINGAVSPEEQAALYRSQFESAQKMVPIGDEIAQLQLDAIRRNGAATPEQLRLINEATNSSIASANTDVDNATSRGLGLIADELSNARGLRLTDSPMSGEAALLAREGVMQKGSIEKSLRANEANAKLNYPLAVQQMQTTASQGQQSVAQAAQQFQQDLRQRAFSNRLAVTGQASSTGLGLASAGGGNAALSALTQQRLNSGSTTTDVSKGLGLSDFGSLAGGLGSALYGYSKVFG